MIISPEDCGCPNVEEGLSITNSPICNGTILFMMMLEGFLRGRCDIATPCQRVRSEDELEPQYDFIVVGSGPAGSIVAGRLSEIESFNVLLLEAGGPEPIGARVPSFYRTFWSNEEVDWNYRTVLGDYCYDQGDKGCLWPRGKVLGGCSVLNGMMYHRGHAADYEDWVMAGAHGWSWEENLPYFEMTEGNKQIGSVVSGKYHSDSGPLPVQQFNYQPQAVYDILDAINETGFPVVADLNDPDTPHGFAIAQAFNDRGQRFTPARVYLKPKSERPNLSVKLRAQVSRVLFEGNRAIGVEYIDENGNTKKVRASKEVILSAGALNSPHILLLSGIGPRHTMRDFQIPLVADLPVGKNLRNHVGATINFLLKSLNNTETLDWASVVEYLLNREGPMTSTGVTQLTGILYSSLANWNRKQPDIQYFFNGYYAECSRSGTIGEIVQGCSQEGLNMSANAAILLPRSIGYLTLNSTDPRVPPIFDPRFFSHPDDMIMAKDGLKHFQKIFETKVFQERYRVVLDPDYTLECDDSGEQWSDSWLECMIRLHTDPQNHQLGTAAIGSVVDTQLKVYDVEGLRVIDASVMPTQPTGNPQAPIMMVAERGATFIKNDWQ